MAKSTLRQKLLGSVSFFNHTPIDDDEVEKVLKKRDEKKDKRLKQKKISNRNKSWRYVKQGKKLDKNGSLT